jgi:hypothetical protein
MSDSFPENRILLAINAIRSTPRLSVRRAAEIYNVPKSTIAARMKGRVAKPDSYHGRSNLTKIEEEVIVQYILERDSRGFSPRTVDVGDMANLLLQKRGARRVGKNWPDRFVARRPEIKTRFNRVYDYQRGLCEDPAIIEPWFRLVANMRAKYGILDCDFYNFDETGFMMGMIRPGMVVTRSDRVGKPKAIQPGNREWATAICSIAGDGYVLPPFLVVKGRFHLASWYSEHQIPDDWAVATTTNGWTDNKTGLEWLQHFDQHTRRRRRGVYRMLVLDGHESHVNAEFEDYCKENKIVALCLPAHSSHLTQPLDIGCYSVLKKMYGAEIERFIKARITHITKPEFFLAFKAAFHRTFTQENVLGGFRGSGLIPYDPQTVLSKLDVKLRTPTPPETPDGPPTPWVFKTPQTTNEALSQSTLIKTRITRHHSSSPTPILAAVDQLSKGMQVVSHRVVILEAEVRTLQQANEALSKRRRAKRTRLQDGGTIDGSQARQIMAEKGVVEEEERVEGEIRVSLKRPRTGSRLCGVCRKTGHNARTCPEVGEIDSSCDSE